MNCRLHKSSARSAVAEIGSNFAGCPLMLAVVLTKAEVKALRNLRDRQHRAATGRFVVEGVKVVTELLAAGFPFLHVYATEDFAAPEAVTTRVSAEEMARITHFPTPSPVLAVGRLESPPLPPAALRRGLTLALDGVQDPGNVGTLLRIADWFGVARVLLSPECADRFSQKTINASMGSFARMPAFVAELPPLLRGLPVPVLGCDLAGTDVAQTRPLADGVIVIGSEGRGLSPAVQACLTARITIRRRGAAESLNAAVAAGIILDRLALPAGS